jgi:hypothetical protein
VGYNSRFSNLYWTFILGTKKQNKNFPISIWFLRAFSIPHFITKKLNGVKQITNETFLFLFGLKEHFHTQKIKLGTIDIWVVVNFICDFSFNWEIQQI